jgi:hypothetical protein
VSISAQQEMANQAPDNVAGKWVVSTLGETGVVHTDYLTIKQEGNVLTGKFKGPNQSGSFNGAINVHHIEIRSNTNHPVVFRGRVEGDTITGKVHVVGRVGEFRAVREP